MNTKEAMQTAFNEVWRRFVIEKAGPCLELNEHNGLLMPASGASAPVTIFLNSLGEYARDAPLRIVFDLIRSQANAWFKSGRTPFHQLIEWNLRDVAYWNGLSPAPQGIEENAK